MLGLLVIAAGLSCGAESFNEDFSDHSPGPNLVLGPGFGSPSTDFAGHFSITSGIGSRIYLGTVATDFNAVSFVFDAEVTIANTANAWAIPFLGMGTTTPRGRFGEPEFPGLYALLVNIEVPGFAQYKDGVDTAGTVVVWARGISNWANATHRFRMEWNAATQRAVFRVDIGNDGNGAFDYSSAAIDGSDNGFTSANSQLYVGGGMGLSIDNVAITVIPESVMVPVRKISVNGETLDFEWEGTAGKTYDLLSSVNLALPAHTWEVYHDGAVTYADIPGSGTSTNVLTGVLRVGSERFFAMRER